MQQFVQGLQLDQIATAMLLRLQREAKPLKFPKAFVMHSIK
jgi:hypothetical protein